MAASINTNDDFDDELLSAYVDEELTAAERALVEERLRVDPQARQMVEELRSLSSAIRSLPRETLGRDLRASIEAEALQAKADAKADDDRNILPMSGHDRWANYRRGLVWSAITIAAALMLMMVQPEDVDQGVRDVAKADRQEELEESRKNRRGWRDDGALPRQGEMRAAGPPEEAASAPAGAVAPSSSAVNSAMPDDMLAELPQRQLDQLEASSNLDYAMEPSAPPASDAAALGTLADQSDVQGDAFKLKALGGAGIAEQAAPAGNSGVDKSKDRLVGAAAVPPTTIELAMTAPDGVARFEKLLRQHAIQLGPEPAADDAKGETKQLEELEKEVADRRGGEAFSRAIESAPAAADFAVKPDVKVEYGADVDVLVEATPEQIDALLLALESDKESFADVSVPPSLARSPANEFKKEAQRRRRERVAAVESLAKEEASTAEKTFAADAPHKLLATAAVGNEESQQRAVHGAACPRGRAAARRFREDESPARKIPPAGKVWVVFQLRPLSPPAATPAAQPAAAKP